MRLTLLTNDQDPSGRWTLYDSTPTADTPRCLHGLLSSDDPADIAKWLWKHHSKTVLMDVDGNGSIASVPVEWIGDGEPIVGSPRALALLLEY